MSDFAAHRAPSWPLRRVWLSILVAFVVLLGAVELGARAFGVAPMVNHTPQFWAWELDQVGADDVVVIGTSRAQRGIDPAIVATYADGRPVRQLAWRGSGSWPVLEYFAAEPSFHGTLIVEIMPSHWTAPSDEIEADFVSRGLIAGYVNRSRILPVEMAARLWTQEHLALAGPDVTLDGLARAIAGEPPIPGRNPLRFLRSGFVDFEPRYFDVAGFERRERRLAGTDPWYAGYTDAAVEASAARLAEATARLQQRGATVIFVRMPTSGRYLQDEERLGLRERVWDVLAARSGGTWLDGTRAPDVAEFTSSDGSHLDHDSAIVFSHWLGAQLDAR